MKTLVKAINEETFKSWDKETQEKWLKDHPYSKFKDLDKIENLRKRIDTYEKDKLYEYQDTGWWGYQKGEQEYKETLKSLKNELKKLERKPHTPIQRYTKPVDVLKKLKIKQKEKPNFSKELEPFTEFSKKTGIRNASDLKKFAKGITEIYDSIGDINSYKMPEGVHEYNKMANELLKKYKGKTINTKNLSKDEKDLLNMLAIYKKEKEFYKKNAENKDKYLDEIRFYNPIQLNREQNKNKEIFNEWIKLKYLEKQNENNPNISPEEKRNITIRRTSKGKELYESKERVEYTKKRIKELEEFKKNIIFDLRQVPILGNPTIDFNKFK